MIVSTRRHFVFLSMPKCASSAIVRKLRKAGDVTALGRSELKHTPYRDLERYVLPWIESRLGLERRDFTVCCLFREPIEWLHSWYRYRSRRALRRPGHKHHHRYTGAMTFDVFARAWLADPRPEIARVGSQAAFVLSGSGEVGPDALYRYEDMDAAIARLERLAGRRIRVRRRNVSPSRPLDLTGETRAALEEALRRDYEIYGAIEEGADL